MKEIKLTKGMVAFVDDEDYEFLSNFKWCVANVYAYNYKIGKMHRFIMKARKGEFVDHINGNTVDNRKINLRICTHKENLRNTIKRKKHSSRYKGVHYDKVNNKWIAQIMVDGKNIFLGRHLKECDAAVAYNFAAEKYFGKFANINVIKC